LGNREWIKGEYPISNSQYPMTKYCFLLVVWIDYLKIGCWKLVIGSSNGAEVEGSIRVIRVPAK